MSANIETMPCPKCGEEAVVLDKDENGPTVLRQYECWSCGADGVDEGVKLADLASYVAEEPEPPAAVPGLCWSCGVTVAVRDGKVRCTRCNADLSTKN